MVLSETQNDASTKLFAWNDGCLDAKSRIARMVPGPQTPFHICQSYLVVSALSLLWIAYRTYQAPDGVNGFRLKVYFCSDSQRVSAACSLSSRAGLRATASRSRPHLRAGIDAEAFSFVDRVRRVDNPRVDCRTCLGHDPFRLASFLTAGHSKKAPGWLGAGANQCRSNHL